MSRFLCSLIVLGSACLFVGCTSNDLAEASPTVRLFRGQIKPDQYAGELTRANEETRDAEQFDVNRQPTRAYNTASGKFEFVPEDTEQHWNEKEQRWEFTPLNDTAE